MCKLRLLNCTTFSVKIAERTGYDAHKNALSVFSWHLQKQIVKCRKHITKKSSKEATPKLLEGPLSAEVINMF